MTPIRLGIVLTAVTCLAWAFLVEAALNSHDSLAGVAAISLTILAAALLLLIWFGVLVAWGWVAGAKARDDAVGSAN